MWKGFLIESKCYMNYPKCGKFYFWKWFPAAFLLFHFYELKDKFYARNIK